MKKLFFVITTLILIFVITILCSEILLRVYVQFTPTMFSPRDKRYNQFRATPKAWINGFQLNSKGFQDIEFSVKKEKGKFRILAIGDSFTFGVVPYENNFITLLEEKLKTINPNIEILNMGIPATRVREYLSLFVDEGLALNPDLVLINFYVGNDIMDAEEKPKESPLMIVRFIKYIPAYFKSRKYQPKFNPNPNSNRPENTYNDEAPSMDNASFEGIQKFYFKIYLNNPIVNKHLEPSYNSVFKDVATIQKICDTKNIKLVLSLLPAEIQVDTNLQKETEPILTETNFRIFDSYPNLLKSLDYSHPNKMLKKEFDKRNINYIDLLPVFQEKGKSFQLYKPKDTHWNIPGNKLAAETIYKYITDSNMNLFSN